MERHNKVEKGDKLSFMKVVVVLVILVFLSTSLGCIGGSTNVKDALKLVPDDDNNFRYDNLKVSREDKDLHDIYKYIKSTELGKEINRLDAVDIDDVNYVVFGKFMIIVGSFDLKGVRDSLDKQGFDKDTYKDTESWVKDNIMVTIIGDKLIAGYDTEVKRVIEVIKGESKSMYDNEDIKDIADKLPDGIRVMIWKGGFGQGPEPLVTGAVVVKEDKNTLNVRYILKFNTEKNAEDSLSDLKNSIRQKKKLSDVNVKQDGKFIEISAKTDIKDIFAVI